MGFSFTLRPPLLPPKAADDRALSELAYWMLFANALWDYSSALSMHADTFLGWTSPIADAHLDMWCLAADRESTAARLLFIVLLVQWGAMRSVAAATDDPLLAVLSYGSEALLTVYVGLQGRLEARRAVFVGVCSVACALVVVLRVDSRP
jgi:hypothetical protein